MLDDTTIARPLRLPNKLTFSYATHEKKPERLAPVFYCIAPDCAAQRIKPQRPQD